MVASAYFAFGVRTRIPLGVLVPEATTKELTPASGKVIVQERRTKVKKFFRGVREERFGLRLVMGVSVGKSGVYARGQ